MPRPESHKNGLLTTNLQTIDDHRPSHYDRSQYDGRRDEGGVFISASQMHVSTLDEQKTDVCRFLVGAGSLAFEVIPVEDYTTSTGDG
jgi:hypothetical protein